MKQKLELSTTNHQFNFLGVGLKGRNIFLKMRSSERLEAALQQLKIQDEIACLQERGAQQTIHRGCRVDHLHNMIQDVDRNLRSIQHTILRHGLTREFLSSRVVVPPTDPRRQWTTAPSIHRGTLEICNGVAKDDDVFARIDNNAARRERQLLEEQLSELVFEQMTATASSYNSRPHTAAARRTICPRELPRSRPSTGAHRLPFASLYSEGPCSILPQPTSHGNKMELEALTKKGRSSSPPLPPPPPNARTYAQKYRDKLSNLERSPSPARGRNTHRGVLRPSSARDRALQQRDASQEIGKEWAKVTRTLSELPTDTLKDPLEFDCDEILFGDLEFPGIVSGSMSTAPTARAILGFKKRSAIAASISDAMELQRSLISQRLLHPHRVDDSSARCLQRWFRLVVARKKKRERFVQQRSVELLIIESDAACVIQRALRRYFQQNVEHYAACLIQNVVRNHFKWPRDVHFRS